MRQLNPSVESRRRASLYDPQATLESERQQRVIHAPCFMKSLRAANHGVAAVQRELAATAPNLSGLREPWEQRAATHDAFATHGTHQGRSQRKHQLV
jgi:hypothetical protein